MTTQAEWPFGARPIPKFTERPVFELPLSAYPYVEAAKTAMSEAPRHDITLHFAEDTPGMCLVCQQATISITLRDVLMTALDAHQPSRGPAMARLSTTNVGAYRFAPCGCEIPA